MPHSYTLSTQDLGHGVATDVELASKLANGKASFVASHEIVNEIGSEAPVHLLDGSRLDWCGCCGRGIQEVIDTLSLVSVV